MKDTILIIVDMQDFFLKRFPISVQHEIIENQKIIIDFCVRRNIPSIIIEYKAGGVERGKTKKELVDSIGNNLVNVIVKDNNGGFTKTNLDVVLNKLNIRKIILMGLNANGCIQDTVIGANNRGYRVITSKGIIANSSSGNMEISKRNKEWYIKNTVFFDNVKSLYTYLSKK